MILHIIQKTLLKDHYIISHAKRWMNAGMFILVANLIIQVNKSPQQISLIL